MSTARTSVRVLAAGVAASICVGGCSTSPSAPDRTGTGDATSAPTSTPAGTAPGTGSGTSAPSSTSAATTPTPSETTRTRQPSDVSKALLDTSEFKPGVRAVGTPTGSTTRPTHSGGTGGPKITSDNPSCAPFVYDAGTEGGIGNAGKQGVTGYASISFQAGKSPLPFLTEEITTVGTTRDAADVLAAIDESVHGCTKLTMTIPRAGTSTLTVSPAPAPPHGDHPSAAHMVGSSGVLKGLDMTVVATGVQDAVLLLTFVRAPQSDVESVTGDAVDHAAAVLR